MNSIKPVIAILISSLIFTGCQTKSKNFLDKPEEVVISGQVINREKYHPNSIAIIINDLASGEQLRFVDELGKDGNFKFRFERYYSQDVMLKYEGIFKVFVRPGDSLNITLDAGKLKTYDESFHSLTFSGDDVNENEQITKFSSWFQPLVRQESNSYVEERKYEPERYFQFRDSIKNIYHRYRIDFVKKNKVSEIVDTWMKYEIEDNYFYNLFLYPMIHRKLNNYPITWEIPLSYYNFYEKEHLPIESIINGQFIKSFSMNYLTFYIYNKTRDELHKKGLTKDSIDSEGRTLHLWIGDLDSLSVDGIRKYTPDGILRQILFNQFFRHHLKTDLFEKYSSVISKGVKEPFLKDPLYKTIKEIKEIDFNSDDKWKTIIDDSAILPGGDILKKILEGNKGKVIYIDCWATWCGPCLNEMPYSRKLMSEFNADTVEFVFLCFHSPKEASRKKVNELKLGGTHYFLDTDQSNHLQSILSFSSFPTYILIDKKGKIVKSGSEISPQSDTTRNDIINLINQK